MTNPISNCHLASAESKDLLLAWVIDAAGAKQVPRLRRIARQRAILLRSG